MALLLRAPLPAVASSTLLAHRTSVRWAQPFVSSRGPGLFLRRPRHIKPAVSVLCCCQVTKLSQPLEGTAQTGRPLLDPQSELQSFSEPKKLLNEGQAFALLNLLALLYGTNTTFVKSILEDTTMPASISSAVRFLVASAAVSPLLFGAVNLGPTTTAKPGLPSDLPFWRSASELGLWLALGYGAQAAALVTSSSSEASVLLTITIITVPILEACVGRPISKQMMGAITFAIAGLAVMQAGAGNGVALAPGTLLSMFSSTMFGVHLFRSEALQARVTNVPQLAAAQLVTCTAFTCAWALYDCLTVPGAAADLLTPEALQAFPWRETLFCGFLGTGLCQSSELVAVNSCRASTAAVVLAMVPVWGLTFGALVHGDRLSELGMVGAGMIIGAGILPRIFSAMDSPEGEEGSAKLAATGTPFSAPSGPSGPAASGPQPLPQLQALMQGLLSKAPSWEAVRKLRHGLSGSALAGFAVPAAAVAQEGVRGGAAQAPSLAAPATGVAAQAAALMGGTTSSIVAQAAAVAGAPSSGVAAQAAAAVVNAGSPAVAAQAVAAVLNGPSSAVAAQAAAAVMGGPMSGQTTAMVMETAAIVGAAGDVAATLVAKGALADALPMTSAVLASAEGGLAAAAGGLVSDLVELAVSANEAAAELVGPAVEAAAHAGQGLSL